jgi:starvation-inducible DNA-binding protein
MATQANNTSMVVVPLRNLFADNFTVYYKSHGYHFNVEGPTFVQDHELLNEIYDFLWAQHDSLGEQLRQLDKPALPSLKAILDTTEIVECNKLGESSKTMFTELCNDFEILIQNAQGLFEVSEEAGYGGLNTYIGDYLRDLNKLHWKVKATIGKSFK